MGFVASGTIAAFAGVVLAARLQVGQSSVGQEFLFPAFRRAARGDDGEARPGECLGHHTRGAVLAVGIAGLQQLGTPFFVEPIFNGAMLILAVGLAVTTARRRNAAATRSRRAAER